MDDPMADKNGKAGSPRRHTGFNPERQLGNTPHNHDDSNISTAGGTPGRPPVTVLFSTQVFTTDETGNALHLVFVDDPRCGKIHQHRTASLDPFIRRARCGSRYRVVPIVSAIEYGTDNRDADLWVDEDGAVRFADGSVRIPEQKSRARMRAA